MDSTKVAGPELHPEVSPLRESAEMLKKLDALLPILTGFCEELEDFRKSLGNGAFNWKFKIQAKT